eukprot:8946964-Lingulodinium_polyedra.AAC.1
MPIRCWGAPSIRQPPTRRPAADASTSSGQRARASASACESPVVDASARTASVQGDVALRSQTGADA